MNITPENINEKSISSSIKLKNSIERVKGNKSGSSKFDEIFIGENKSTIQKHLSHLNPKLTLKSYFQKNSNNLMKSSKLKFNNNIEKLKKQINDIDLIAKAHDRHFKLNYRGFEEDVTLQYWKNISGNKRINQILLKIRNWNSKKEKEMFSLKTFQREFDKSWYEHIKNLEIEEYEKLLKIINYNNVESLDTIDLQERKKKFRNTKMSLLKKLENPAETLTSENVGEKFRNFLKVNTDLVNKQWKSKKKAYHKMEVFTPVVNNEVNKSRYLNITTRNNTSSKKVRTEPIMNDTDDHRLYNELIKKFSNSPKQLDGILKTNESFVSRSRSSKIKKIDVSGLTEENIITNFGYNGYNSQSTSPDPKMKSMYRSKLPIDPIKHEIKKNEKKLEKWKDFNSMNLRNSNSLKIIENFKKNKQKRNNYPFEVDKI